MSHILQTRMNSAQTERCELHELNPAWAPWTHSVLVYRKDSTWWRLISRVYCENETNARARFDADSVGLADVQ